MNVFHSNAIDSMSMGILLSIALYIYQKVHQNHESGLVLMEESCEGVHLQRLVDLKMIGGYWIFSSSEPRGEPSVVELDFPTSVARVLGATVEGEPRKNSRADIQETDTPLAGL